MKKGKNPASTSVKDSKLSQKKIQPNKSKQNVSVPAKVEKSTTKEEESDKPVAALEIDSFDWTGINNRVDSSDEEQESSDDDEEEQAPEGSIMAYRGSPLNNYGGIETSNAHNKKGGLLPLPATSNKKRNVVPLQYNQLQARESMPLLSRSRPGQTLQGKATPGKAMFLLLKSFVTTGIMFLPKA